jgi:uncharacterized protein (DUF1697 family)
VTTYVALLRAINLGSHNKIAMADLKALFADLGMHEPITLILSGNVVFGSRERSAARLESLLESATAKALGVTTDYFVRTAESWIASIAANPFPKEARANPGHLVMMCLKDPPRKAAVTALHAAIKGREDAQVKGAHAYLVYRDGIGRSRLTTATVEKALGTRGTARNWNTVLKLAAMLENRSRSGS